jgi:nucleoside-diphosphate-sugar epimerase
VITILGASGFIGSNLLAAARTSGIACFAPGRGELLDDRDLGTVVYCIGLTASFRERPLDAIEAHVGLLADLLARGRFDRLLYLSSTRVYRRTDGLCSETSPLVFAPHDPDDLYGLSKAAGEAAVLSIPSGVVLRLSNVYGLGMPEDGFLGSILRDVETRASVILQQAPSSAKDYVGLGDVVDLTLRIASSGRERIYNVASGRNVTHAELAAALAGASGATVRFADSAPAEMFPPVDISRAVREFGFRPSALLADLPALLAARAGTRA